MLCEHYIIYMSAVRLYRCCFSPVGSNYIIYIIGLLVYGSQRLDYKICLYVNNFIVFRNMNIVVYTFYDFRFMHITSYFYCIKVVISCDSYSYVISAFVEDN